MKTTIWKIVVTFNITSTLISSHSSIVIELITLKIQMKYDINNTSFCVFFTTYNLLWAQTLLPRLPFKTCGDIVIGMLSEERLSLDFVLTVTCLGMMPWNLFKSSRAWSPAID